jgi:hypothetical protein
MNMVLEKLCKAIFHMLIRLLQLHLHSLKLTIATSAKVNSHLHRSLSINYHILIFSLSFL